MTTFRTLDLALTFYETTTKLKIKVHLKDQLLRAASSISLNLSEGNAKAPAKDKRHLFQMAYGSMRECQTIFKLMKVDDGNLLVLSDRLAASLYKLIHSQIKDSPNWRPQT